MPIDALVLGSGVAGVAAALRLGQQKKKVAIVSRGVGASALGSGAWDFGRVTQRGMSLDALLATLPWPKQYASVEGPRASAMALLEQIEPYLPHSVSWDQPFLLPSVSGGFRWVFCAQRMQTRFDFSKENKKRFGLVAAKPWRFRSDLLAKQLSEELTRLGFTSEIIPVDLPLVSKGVDVPLSRVAADLGSSESAWQAFLDSARQLPQSFDGYLFPPIFPNALKYQELSTTLPVPCSEMLAWLDPAPGFRLIQAFKSALEGHGIPTFECESLKFGMVGDRLESLQTFGSKGENFTAESYILATGRLIGGGLVSSRQRVSESVFDLPLFGEGALRGLRTDASYRPLSEDGMPAFQNLFACGTVLGGVDYLGDSVGMGFGVSTGRACVASLS